MARVQYLAGTMPAGLAPACRRRRRCLASAARWPPRLLQSHPHKRVGSLQVSTVNVSMALAAHAPAPTAAAQQQQRLAAAAKRPLTDAIKRRCEGTLGTWCIDFHTQAEVPAVTAPRGNRTCSMDCNQVGAGGGGGGGLLLLLQSMLRILVAQLLLGLWRRSRRQRRLQCAAGWHAIAPP